MNIVSGGLPDLGSGSDGPACFPETYFTYEWSFVDSGDGVWYHYSQQASTWDQAVQKCQLLESDSTIASILNEQEQTTLSRYLVQQNMPVDYLWVGGFSWGSHKQGWYWFGGDDSILSMGPTGSNYTAWKNDSPISVYDCVNLDKKSSFRWGNSFCQKNTEVFNSTDTFETIGYVCQVRC